MKERSGNFTESIHNDDYESEYLQTHLNASQFVNITGRKVESWYDPDFEKLPKILSNSNPDKPVLICEFGGDARLGQRGTTDELWTEDKQKRIFEQQMETLNWLFMLCRNFIKITCWLNYVRVSR